jgi:hypothetical protein
MAVTLGFLVILIAPWAVDWSPSDCDEGSDELGPAFRTSRLGFYWGFR